MLKKLLILTGVVFFLSCGGGSSKEAKELLQKILTIIGIPPNVITNICQTSNSSDMCEGLKLHKLENSKTKTWQKIKETGVGQYLIETTNPCEPILLELKDDDVDYDSGEFFLKFSGVELGKTSKELSILEAMVDASYLSANSVSSIKTLNSSDAQNRFYATLYGDLKKNINTLRTAGLTKTQSIRGTLKEMAEELKDYGIDSTLPTKINACNDDMGCVEGELTELSSKLLIYASETDVIVEAQKDNNAPMSVKEVSCEEEALDLNKGLVAYYKFEGNAKDSSGNGNDGTEYGGVSYSDGVIGQAGSFDGVDDYIRVKHKDTLNLKNMTLSAWVYDTIYTENNIILLKGIWSTANSQKRQYEFSSSYESTNLSNFSLLNSNEDWEKIKSKAKIPLHTWTYISVSYDGNIQKIYINGELNNYRISSFNIFTPSSPEDLTIGTGFTDNGRSNRRNGLIDDLRIYNRALDETEIAELYKMGNQ